MVEHLLSIVLINSKLTQNQQFLWTQEEWWLPAFNAWLFLVNNLWSINYCWNTTVETIIYSACFTTLIMLFPFFSDNDHPRIISSIDHPLEGQDNVVLTCVPATTDSIVAFEWYKDKRFISSGTNDTYMIPGNKRTNSGAYQCKVYAKNIPISPLSNRKNVTFLCK